MTTKELTSRIIEDIISQIPIDFDGDEQGIREEMSALIYDNVERYHKQMVDKACRQYCSLHKMPNCDVFDECKMINDFRKALEL